MTATIKLLRKIIFVCILVAADLLVFLPAQFLLVEYFILPKRPSIGQVYGFGYSYSMDTVDLVVNNQTFRLAKAYLLSRSNMRGGKQNDFLAKYNYPEMTPAGFEGKTIFAPFSPGNNGLLLLRNYGPDVYKIYAIRMPENPHRLDLRQISASEWLDDVERFMVSVDDSDSKDKHKTLLFYGRMIYKWNAPDNEFVWASCDLDGRVPHPACDFYFMYDGLIIDATVPKSEPLDIKNTYATLRGFLNKIRISRKE